MRRCVSCASSPSEADFPAPKRGQRRLCNGCLDEQRRSATTEYISAVTTRKLITRASYRARLRARSNSPQLDLIDAITRCP